MEGKPALIYCANGNPTFADIAAHAGFAIGAQLPGTVYHPVHFADQDWKKPDRTAYMTALAKHRPVMATVLDWEKEEQLPDVLSWAEEAAQYVQDAVMIIPKVVNGIERLPHEIGGKPIVLGYSVPTKFGATPCVWWEFEKRRVHLLGGSPHKQMREWDYLRRVAEVVSCDGNMANKMATSFNKFWCIAQGRPPFWATLRDTEGVLPDGTIKPAGELWGDGAPTEAFRRSCHNIVAAWSKLKQ